MKKKLFMTVCGLLSIVAVQAQPLLKTHVETGDVEGILDGNDLAVYKAIPYAAPPVGDLRWKAPQPAKPWKGVLKAEDVAKWPPQPEKSYVKYDMMSEDCLYLSVVTPAKTVNEALPVMVFIHGGSFATEHYGAELWQSLARKRCRCCFNRVSCRGLGIHGSCRSCKGSRRAFWQLWHT